MVRRAYKKKTYDKRHAVYKRLYGPEMEMRKIEEENLEAALIGDMKGSKTARKQMREAYGTVDMKKIMSIVVEEKARLEEKKKRQELLYHKRKLTKELIRKHGRKAANVLFSQYWELYKMENNIEE